MQHKTGVGRVVVLGIESSCDETAAAVIAWDGTRAEVLGDVILSQTEAHAAFGGVVPEIAARAHVEALDQVVAAALRAADLPLSGCDAVAATAGPGLIGGVMAGLLTGKALAFGAERPFFPINHLEGHALSPLLDTEAGLDFPYLLLLASGGHCQILLVKGLGLYRRLGATIDDAAGEAFDKVAKVLELGFPGGPAVERLAANGDPDRFDLPKPLLNRPGLDFSFAGLKTAVLRAAQTGLDPQAKADLAAGFQAAIAAIFADRARKALQACAASFGATPRFVIAGGVAANLTIRSKLQAVCAAAGARFFAPPLRFCTDNAAMIALAGAMRFRAGIAPDEDAPARPRWPLDGASEAHQGEFTWGRKGAKA